MNIDSAYQPHIAAIRRPPRRPRRWTAEQRERVRQAALRNKPWLKSTGPRTAAGKARSAANGPNHRKKRVRSPEAEDAMADAKSLAARMVELRQMLGG